MPRSVEDSPFEFTSLLRLIGSNGLAAGVVAFGWYVLSGQPELAAQLSWLNLSIAGLLIALWSNARWLMEGRRAVGLALRELQVTPDRERIHQPVATVEDGLVAGADMLRYHRLGCPLGAGRGWPVASQQDHLDAGRQPCGVCRP